MEFYNYFSIRLASFADYISFDQLNGAEIKYND